MLLPVLTVFGQEQEIPRFQVSTNLVLIDVRIRDGQGRPVRGLSRDDFTILEEGVAQSISVFQEVWLPLSVTETTQPEAAAKSGPTTLNSAPDAAAPAPDKRLLILLFNYASAGLQDTHMMEEAARKFLDSQFTPDDAAAVLVFNNGLQMLTDFTSDRAVLSRAINGLDSSANPEIDFSLPDEDSEEESEEGEFLADESEFALFETNRQLSAIQSIADAFRDVTGRKALIYFSPGLTSRGVENDQEMRWTTDLCNRANISVYSVDTRGLVALSPGGGAQRAGGRGTSIFTGRSSLNQLASLVSSQDGLITLSEDTGGVALIDDNDLSKIFRQAQQDASHYYLVGYHRPQPPRDGRFRKIEVRLAGSTEGLRVDYRRGYYADKPYRALSRSEKEFELLQTVLEERPRSDFPLQMSSEFFPAAGGRYQVPVLLAFDRSQLAVWAAADLLNLEVVILARGPQDRTRAAVRDQVEIRRRGREDDPETRFVYQNLLLLDPGSYRLTAYLRDNRTGRMARADHRLELPPDGLLRTSSLVLAGSWRKPGSPAGYRVRSGKHVTMIENPLQVAGRLLIPRVGAVFRPGESLYLHARISVQAAQPDAPSGQYQIFLQDEDLEQIFESGWKPLSAEKGQPLSVNARLPLDTLGEGHYRVWVEVRLPGYKEQVLTRNFQVHGR
ncbi:MAG: VWA domain-containing protein [Acidobacteriota bacterium]